MIDVLITKWPHLADEKSLTLADAKVMPEYIIGNRCGVD